MFLNLAFNALSLNDNHAFFFLVADTLARLSGAFSVPKSLLYWPANLIIVVFVSGPGQTEQTKRGQRERRNIGYT